METRGMHTLCFIFTRFRFIVVFWKPVSKGTQKLQTGNEKLLTDESAVPALME